jgi:hypothetical protein
VQRELVASSATESAFRKMDQAKFVIRVLCAVTLTIAVAVLVSAGELWFEQSMYYSARVGVASDVANEYSCKAEMAERLILVVSVSILLCALLYAYINSLSGKVKIVTKIGVSLFFVLLVSLGLNSIDIVHAEMRSAIMRLLSRFC